MNKTLTAVEAKKVYYLMVGVLESVKAEKTKVEKKDVVAILDSFKDDPYAAMLLGIVSKMEGKKTRTDYKTLVAASLEMITEKA